MNMSKATLFGASVSLLAAQAAFAQQARAPDTQPAAPGQVGSEQSETNAQAGVADIIVTATRRSANLQTVPLTIAAFDTARLTATGVKSAVDLPNLVSGLTLNRFGAGTNSFLRGVGSNNTGFTSEPQIATYIDGFYVPYSGAAAFSFSNIERVEVLKGPQGTLYGRNSTGGLINVITRDPGKDARIDASLQYANYDTLTENVYASAPLSDTVSADFAFTHARQSEGWGRNLFTGSETQKLSETGAQAKLIWKPTSRTKVSLQGFYDNLRTDQGSVIAIYPGSVGTDGTPYLGRYRSATRIDPSLRVESYLIGLKIDQDLGFADLLSLTGYQRSLSPATLVQTGEPGNPVAGQAAAAIDLVTNARTVTQEFQLKSNDSSSSRFDWIAGLFYYNNNLRVSAGTYSTCAATVCAPAPVPTQTISYPNTRSYSGYGEGTFKITPTTRITLGLRYTDDQLSISGTTLPYSGFPNTPAVLASSVVVHPGDPYPGNPNGIPTATSFSKLTYKAVLAQDIGSGIHAYASYNRGFKSGGYNPTVFVNTPSRPEVLDAFEVGLKSDLFNRLLRLNVAGFYYDYKDIQLRTTAPPAPPGLAILYNAASARVKGVDADFELVPTRNLSLTASLEYLDGKYTKFPGATCTTPRTIAGAISGGNASAICDVSGNRLINSPRFSYTVGATYRLDSEFGTFSFAVNDSHKSRYYFDPNNRLTQEPYHLLNASVTWTEPNRHYDVQLFVKNLTKSYYFVTAQEAGTDIYVAGAPQTFGVTVGLHF